MLRCHRLAALTCALLISVAAAGAERAKPEFVTSDDPARRDLPFSDAVRAGDLMFLSGQIGWIPPPARSCPAASRPKRVRRSRR
jgi:2-iminobutanoate/2-iminopropanoate deaminase